MLTRLMLQNIAIIEALELEFQTGLNVITGETGSGKSLILDAIQRVFDKRSSAKELLRHGAGRGRIELTFNLDQVPNRAQIETLLQDAGVEILPDEYDLTLGREISPSSSRCRVNGCVVSLDVMEKLGGLMLEIYGQHDLHTLFSSSRQRDLMDNIGGEPLHKVRMEVRYAFRECQRIRSEIEALQTKRQHTERQLDFMTFQLQELTQAELSEPNEDTLLQEERNRLAHCEKLQHTAMQATQILTEEEDYESPSIMKQLGQLQKTLIAGVTYDPQFTQWCEKIVVIQEELSTLNQELNRYGQTMDTRPERMKEIIDRLDVLEKLKRKYGGSLEAVLKTATELEAQLDILQQGETYLDDLQQKLVQAEARYLHLSETLTELRQRIASSLEETIQTELQTLMLPAAQFRIAIAPTAPTENGQEQITFLFSANPGEPLKPLAQVASGGELARLMLALKIQTAHADSLSTLILDEIDTGMSGITVRAVTEKLLALKDHCQIIVVTHQPIVAAKAQWHFHVRKELLADGVRVTTTPLINREQRKAVLSQLASGFTEDDTATLQFIEQLLAY